MLGGSRRRVTPHSTPGTVKLWVPPRQSRGVSPVYASGPITAPDPRFRFRDPRSRWVPHVGPRADRTLWQRAPCVSVRLSGITRAQIPETRKGDVRSVRISDAFPGSAPRVYSRFSRRRDVPSGHAGSKGGTCGSVRGRHGTFCVISLITPSHREPARISRRSTALIGPDSLPRSLSRCATAAPLR